MLEGAVDCLEEVLAGRGGILRVGRAGTERGWTMMEERMRGVVDWDVETGVPRES